MTKLTNPIPLFLDGRGALLDGGYIYVGTADLDPEVPANQLPLFTDKALTVPIAQPLRTLGGVIVNGLNLAQIYFAAADFSITVRDADLNLVYNKGSAFDLSGTSYQPLDADLTAIAALTTTAYGRALLTLADQAALRAAVGTGTAAYLAEATVGEYRANTPDKVLTTDVVWASAAPTALSQSGGSVAVDLATGINFTLAMTGGPWTLSSPVNAKPGQSGTIEITQDATGGRVLNFAANWTFAGGVDPVLSTSANARDILSYQIMADGTAFASLAKARG